MFLNHLLLTYNSEKEFVGWNSKWEGNEQNLGTKSRSGNSFKRRKEGEAPYLLYLLCDSQYLHTKFGY